jgi:hypothetical protein
MASLWPEDWYAAPPLCSMRCTRPAWALVDGEPWCLDCLDEMIGNDGALPLAMARRVEEAKARPLPPPTYRPAPGDDAQLKKLRAAWISSKVRESSQTEGGAENG